IQQLHAALLSAFPKRSDLERMLRFELDARLDEITDVGNLNDTVFRVIEWAEANGRIHDLIRGARNQNPGHAGLAALALRIPDPKLQDCDEDLTACDSEPTKTPTAARKTRWIDRVPVVPERASGWLALLVMVPGFLIALVAAHAGNQRPSLMLAAVLWVLFRLVMSGSLRAALKAALETPLACGGGLGAAGYALVQTVHALIRSQGMLFLDWLAGGVMAAITGLLAGSLAEWLRKPERGAPARLLLRECPLLGWVLLAASGPGLALPDADPTGWSFRVAWAGAFSVLGPLLAWWEGDASEPRTSAAGVTALLAAASHRQPVAAAFHAGHDAIIGEWLVPAPFPHTWTGPVYYLLVFAASAMGMIYMLMLLPAPWAGHPLNKRVVGLVDWSLRVNPTGHHPARLRHLFHHRRLQHLGAVLLRVWQVLLGRFPDWVVPKPYAPGRYLQILRRRLADEELRATACMASWRLSTFKPAGPEAATVGQAAEQALRLWGQRLLALGNRLDCPGQSCSYGGSPEVARELAALADRYLSVARWLPERGDALDAVLEETSARLRAHCELLAARDDTPYSTFLRMRKDRGTAAGLPDGQLFHLRDHVLEVCRREALRLAYSSSAGEQDPVETYSGWFAWAAAI
ncbi:MAG: hypothetical protein K0Q72_65, partial [Armatimonadetes bacterium]|nr:hypothetical protein [Armatimonadota bacterium]